MNQGGDRLEATLGKIALVAIGGFAGAVSRWGVSLVLPDAFPWGTLAVNVAGSFLLGLLVADGRIEDSLPSSLRLLAATGFLASFTTYSTFALETTALGPVLGTANVTANLTLGISAAFVGRYLAGGVE